ncbi:PREDICTED: E3 SUMO-protein ligase NSE2 [Thamnophis sirtalis]|uniref:E3 SUMO-protein ligase NSE2 n=1 Tax=Thamnophis sirtalis TaxID=35019 RepID=A0A6I9Z239_9SAUR|nr:PREDICTED: E3 SUMO-protein ligase NSE2 [Thamnophis sirtalis]
MSGRPLISLSGVDTCLTSLKTCKTYINTGMDITTNVALDLVENHNDPGEINAMEEVMLEYALMHRELSHYVQAVEDTVKQIKQDKPEIIPNLRHLVMEKFRNLESKNCSADLQRNEKVVLFKEQIKQMKAQFGIQPDAEEGPALEQLDEDLAVTQSQRKFICPITQEEMKKPVRNKICGHTYEEEAILEHIRRRQQHKKKVNCPQVGCNNKEVRKADLVFDEVLKRTIDVWNKRSQSTQ